MKFFKSIWNGIHTKAAVYIFFVLSVLSFTFFNAATWTHGWIAELYPLGDKFVPTLLTVIAVCSILHLGYMFILMMTAKDKPIRKNLPINIIHTIISVLSIVAFVYTVILFFGLDSGINAEAIMRAFGALKIDLPIAMLISFIPLAGLFAGTPKKSLQSMIASILVATLAVVPLQLSDMNIASSGNQEIPEMTFMSENQLKDGVISEEMLKDGEKADAKNLLTDDKSCWTPQDPNRMPADGCPNNMYSYAEIKLPEKRTFNTALIDETGNQVQYFRLQAKVNDEWVTVYRSEKIQAQRLCSFDAVTTDSVRLVIDKWRDTETPAQIRSIKLYNEPVRDAKNFEVTTYQRLDGDVPTEILAKGEDYVNTYARYYDVYSTVIIFGAVHWDDSGNMNFGSLGEEGFAREINALKEIIDHRSNKNHDVKIICTALADGAWDSNVNIYMTMYWESIADKIAEFVKKYDFDGVDIDWEYPQTKDDWAVFDKFIARLDENMKSDGEEKILSAALSAWGLGMTEETLDRFDQIQFMAYDGNDQDGYQSSLRQAQEGLQAFKDNGADISKINIGIAAYARPVNSGPFWGVWRDFEDANYWDSKYYNINDAGQVYEGTFCSPAVAGDKTAYALFCGAGGVMVFRTACDKTMDDPNAVACGIENALKRYVAQ